MKRRGTDGSLLEVACAAAQQSYERRTFDPGRVTELQKRPEVHSLFAPRPLAVRV